MKKENEIKLELQQARANPPKTWKYEQLKGYIEALEWVLEQ